MCCLTYTRELNQTKRCTRTCPCLGCVLTHERHAENNTRAGSACKTGPGFAPELVLILNTASTVASVVQQGSSRSRNEAYHTPAIDTQLDDFQALPMSEISSSGEKRRDGSRSKEAIESERTHPRQPSRKIRRRVRRQNMTLSLYL